MTDANNNLTDHSLQPAIHELERAFQHFSELLLFKQQKMPMPVITIQAAGRRKALGWFLESAWQNDGAANRIPEINMSAEHLGRGIYEIANTLIHEMVHLSNYLAGIKDCSSTQYHNKRFKELAESVGLVCERADDGANRAGWGYTALSKELQIQVDEFGFDESAFSLFRNVERQLRVKGEGRGNNNSSNEPKLKKWSCGCTNFWCAVDVVARCEKPDCGNDFERTAVLGK
ncbi:SprT-like domain-containing protein [Pirellulales bacterium]|nr:SprT-like domain-containing protein [Pirellulales bacterium]